MPKDILTLRALSNHLRAEIKGQDHVIERVNSVLQRGELGLSNPRRPKGSFLFVGPTGVGKTELTNVFTHFLFNGSKPVRFDMSEYQSAGSVEKLIGEKVTDAGLFGRAMRNITFGTLLFDEIEKAHPLVLDLFLQMLEDAMVTVASGKTISLKDFYIVFTSNIGANEAMRMQSAPLASIERTVLSRVGQELRPELVGRITEKIVFMRLPFEVQRSICEKMIADELSRLRSLGWSLTIAPSVIELIIREGYHKTLGMRPMRGTVERQLQSAIVTAALNGLSTRQLAISTENDRLNINPI